MSRFIIETAGIKAIAERKNVKYIRLSIKPPDGQVYVSIPKRSSIDSARRFIEAKQSWIRENQEKLCQRAQNVQHEDDSVMLWGQKLPLRVVTGVSRSRAEAEHDGVVLYLRSQADFQQKTELLEAMMRSQIMERLPGLAEKWEKIMGVHATEWRTRKMKTRWGSCNVVEKRIWLNLRLAMLPPECLEYVVVHELCHLHEPSHNERFKALVNSFYPGWREVKAQMQQLSGVLW